MASDTNVVILVGRLTRDPELRALPSGSSVCQLGIAVNGFQKNQAGEYEDKPNFFNVTAFGGLGERIAQFCSKGDQIAVNGRLEWRTWETDGQKRESVQVVAGQVQFLTPRKGSTTDTKEEAPF